MSVLYFILCPSFRTANTSIILLANYEHVDVNGAKGSQAAKAVRLNPPLKHKSCVPLRYVLCFNTKIVLVFVSPPVLSPADIFAYHFLSSQL